MIDLIIGISAGIGTGWALAQIAPEEIIPGRKYFLIFKTIVFSLIFLLVAWSWAQQQNYWLLGIFSITFIILSRIGSPARYKPWQEVPRYALFIAAYFLMTEKEVPLLLSSLMFLYGMPTGTLLLKDLHLPRRTKK